MRIPVHCLCLLLVAAFARAGEMRKWTDVQQRTIEARMLGMEKDSVILELRDGRKVTFPLARLSAADADYVRSQGAQSATKPGDDVVAADFDASWPERIKFSEDPEIVVVEENAEKKSFIYESVHYRYICDVRLSKSVVKGFAVMFEATYLFCRALPLRIDGGEKIDGKLQIRLFEKTADYESSGGKPGTAGYFFSGTSMVYVPLTSLGVRRVGSGYMMDRSKRNNTLTHELTHQLTPIPYFRTAAKGWFSEGLAEYVAVTPYRSGSFSVRNNHHDIIDYVTAFGDRNRGGRALGKEIHLPSLKAFMLQSYDDFLARPQLNYGASLLITYYFLQLDGEGDGKRIKEFLKALRQGKDREDALMVLLDGRTFEQLEEEITKAWSRKGIEITFGQGK